MNQTRVAWLLTTAYYYWQPAMAHLTKIFPNTTVFTTVWKGFAPGFEDSFKFELVGDRKIISLSKSTTGYGNNFTYMPLNIGKRLLEFKPDVVFANAFGVWTILALLFKPLGKWKVAIAYEGSSPSVDFRNSPHRLYLRKVMANAADALISNSNEGKNYLTQVLKVPETKVFVQPYEVPCAKSLLASHNSSPEISQIQPESKSESHHPVFLFVGQIVPRKGLHLLLAACTSLAKKGVENYTIQIIGDGKQVEELKQYCRENQLEEHIQWLGRVDYGCLGEYFRRADAFILPTLEDTWGLVILEAMILGKAILTSKWAGASELVVEGENGYLFDPYQPETIAAVMERAIENPQLLPAMGKKSQEIMNKYTPEAAGKFLADVTSFVLGNQHEQ
ncbi:glycosyltransferase family 4 protein [Calothrix sp. PCC 6303]|uniref:glycosyltransferase family 4 protein n=1 Tax=Calothrix sp. PCC 6303 TaxID=1170562 RepID=UPI0002A0220B|nr:glycosyltransferase family 4 protein [Calothrix sp. PCC 6303]AFZ01174.1 glycosyl transferase group 1 [Calothrix sp. PCC 6303]